MRHSYIYTHATRARARSRYITRARIDRDFPLAVTRGSRLAGKPGDERAQAGLGDEPRAADLNALQLAVVEEFEDGGATDAEDERRLVRPVDLAARTASHAGP